MFCRNDHNSDDVTPYHGAHREPDEAESKRDPLDDLIDGVTSTITSRSKEKEAFSNLDEAVSESIGRFNAKEDDERDFEASRPYREELSGRYGRERLGPLLDRFIEIGEGFRHNPLGMADRLASDYLTGVPADVLHAVRAQVAKEATGKDAKAQEADADLHPSKKLDKILDGAQDENKAKALDAEDRKQTAAVRAKLKQIYPNKTFSEALKLVTEIDRDLILDPTGAAGRLAAMYGAPITEGQHVQAQYAHAQIEQASECANFLTIAQQSGLYPNMAQLAPLMGMAMQDPNFRSTGNPWEDLDRAYQAAEVVGFHMHWSEQNRAAVAKADRVGGSVRGTGSRPRSNNSNNNGGTLDSIISNALSAA